MSSLLKMNQKRATNLFDKLLKFCERNNLLICYVNVDNESALVLDVNTLDDRLAYYSVDANDWTFKDNLE